MRMMLGLVLAACGSAAPAAVAPVGNTGPATPGAPAAAPGPTAMLVLDAGPAGGCTLRRVEVGRPTADLAHVPDACTGGRLARDATSARVLAWFDPELGAAAAKLYTVDAGVVAPLPAWTGPDPLRFVGFGADDAILAFTEHDIENTKPPVRYLGHTLDFSDHGEGMPAAAVTYRLAGAAWQLVDVERTTTGWDYAAGYAAAALAKTVGPESFTQLDGHFETGVLTDAQVRAALAALAPAPDPQTDDGWQQASVGPHRFYVYIVTGEFAYTTAALAWPASGGGVEPFPAASGTVTDIVSLVPIAGRYLLVASSREGARPRLYDLVERRVVYQSDTARAVLATRS